MDSDENADPRREALERELWRARVDSRKTMARILSTAHTDLDLIQRDAREMSAVAGRIDALTSLLKSLS